ncbi:class I SAM-dependent methyltransferase [Rhabdothermincola salaria]|uniref:class I SAM-dependent methyltransferase n=1 Tax=Rhabdothermincola salaria TaxID=2903142 RepID=UPI001E610B01|nr:class I SAM-dependent methyltransferase [Rhabdothermincola salaria]MCD9622536.1 class I SAM-dependent methyltransferase [Rhabdothermincola salaria]
MDADAWNARYDTAELVWSGEPNQFLPPEIADLEPGTALDLACGEGRNAIWLATQGWTVTGVDFSSVGVAKARRLAGERGVEVDFQIGDATEFEPPEQGYDLVIVFYLQLPADERRAAVANAVRSLAPGGHFVYVAHDLLNLSEGYGGPDDAVVLATAEGIVDDMASASLEYGLELDVERAERVDRPVPTPDGERIAIDTLVRARRLDTISVADLGPIGEDVG